MKYTGCAKQLVSRKLWKRSNILNVSNTGRAAASACTNFDEFRNFTGLNVDILAGAKHYSKLLPPNPFYWWACFVNKIYFQPEQRILRLKKKIEFFPQEIWWVKTRGNFWISLQKQESKNVTSDIQLVSLFWLFPKTFAEGFIIFRHTLAVPRTFHFAVAEAKLAHFGLLFRRISSKKCQILDSFTRKPKWLSKSITCTGSLTNEPVVNPFALTFCPTICKSHSDHKKKFPS